MSVRQWQREGPSSASGRVSLPMLPDTAIGHFQEFSLRPPLSWPVFLSFSNERLPRGTPTGEFLF
jgi:hypothetical protein